MFFYRGSDFWRSPTVRHGRGRANRGGEQQMCAANGHCRPQRRSVRSCRRSNVHCRWSSPPPPPCDAAHFLAIVLPPRFILLLSRIGIPPLRPVYAPSYFTFAGCSTPSSYTFPDPVLCTRRISVTPVASCGHQRRAVVIPPSRPRGAARW